MHWTGNRNLLHKLRSKLSSSGGKLSPVKPQFERVLIVNTAPNERGKCLSLVLVHITSKYFTKQSSCSRYSEYVYNYEPASEKNATNPH